VARGVLRRFAVKQTTTFASTAFAKRPVLLAVALAGATGCISTNTFSNARALEEGEFMHIVGVSVHPATDSGEIFAPTLLPLPSYGLRIGVGHDIELGGTLSLLARAHLDAKYHAYGSKHVDLAVSAGAFAQFYRSQSGNDEGSLLTGGQLLGLMDLNASESISIIPWIGPGLAWAPETGTTAPFVRAGLGFDVRLGSLSIHPEVSTVWDPARKEAVDLAAGFAFEFGDRPRYGEPLRSSREVISAGR
jgi:hypothetical protein